MKRLFLLLILILAVGISQSRAQTVIDFSGGLNIALPTGDFANYTGFGYGVSARVDFHVLEKSELYLLAGYMKFTGERMQLFSGSFERDYTMVPFLIGIKHDFNENWYGVIDVGVHILSYEYDFYNVPSNNPSSVPDDITTNSFGIGFGLGMQTPISDEFMLDILPKFNFVEDDANYLDFRVGVRYRITVSD